MRVCYNFHVTSVSYYLNNKGTGRRLALLLFVKILNRPQTAIYHAERCLEICTVNEIGDFDIAFAFEAIARAYAVAGEFDKSQEYIKLGKQASEQIEDEGNREYFLSELSTVSELFE